MKVLPLGSRADSRSALPGQAFRPEDGALVVADADGMTVRLGEKHPSAGQDLRLHRALQAAQVQAQAAVRSALPDPAGVELDGQRGSPAPGPSSKRARSTLSPFCCHQAAQVQRALRRPSSEPRTVAGGSLVAGEAEQGFLGLPGQFSGPITEQGDEHGHGPAVAADQQGGGGAGADVGVRVGQETGDGVARLVLPLRPRTWAATAAQALGGSRPARPAEPRPPNRWPSGLPVRRGHFIDDAGIVRKGEVGEQHGHGAVGSAAGQQAGRGPGQLRSRPPFHRLDTRPSHGEPPRGRRPAAAGRSNGNTGRSGSISGSARQPRGWQSLPNPGRGPAPANACGRRRTAFAAGRTPATRPCRAWTPAARTSCSSSASILGDLVLFVRVDCVARVARVSRSRHMTGSPRNRWALRP